MSHSPQGASAPINALNSLSEASPLPFEATAFPFDVASKDGLGVCPNTAMKLVRSGELESFKIGARRLVTGGAIIACQKRLAAREKAKRGAQS